MPIDRMQRRVFLAVLGGAVVAWPLAAVSVEARILNIVAIGASNTAGWGVGSENSFPSVLQVLLRKRGINATVTNAGIPGDVTAGMLNRLDRRRPPAPTWSCFSRVATICAFSEPRSAALRTSTRS